MSAPRRVGVLGGTFDPVHLGHLVVASEVHHALALDEVVLVPAGEPWQKGHRAVTPAEHRVRMTELAVAPDPRLRCSRVDVDRGGPTYSLDTAADLRAEYGADTELYLVNLNAASAAVVLIVAIVAIIAIVAIAVEEVAQQLCHSGLGRGEGRRGGEVAGDLKWEKYSI